MNRLGKKSPTPTSAEGKRKGLGARIEELDREGAVADRAFLPDQLVETLLLHLPDAVGVRVDAGVLAERLTVERDAIAHRLAAR